jgi:hypothetical protein
LSGEIEVKVLVGPADAVGLEPLAIGTVPFAVVTSEAPYVIEGQGSITYEGVLEKEWGTYEVTLDLGMAIGGECVGGGDGEGLHMILDMTGEQLVEVTAEGFHGEYPWAGTHTFEVDFPLMDGATAEGEGWVFVLHLPTP